ncbi:hypothetical protein B0H10DRAFT_1951237 [Mycena sp. CBHHK59/15]|nr:hypothetical protein B0H10DRAFT_1951237 [Mycena sp. CBHHK59/15]
MVTTPLARGSRHRLDARPTHETRLKALQQLARDQELEIKQLRSQLGGVASTLNTLQPRAGPSTPRRQGIPMQSYMSVDSFPERHADSSPIAGPSKLPELDLFWGLLVRDPIPDPRSDFDYVMALQSEYMDTVLRQIADFDGQDRPLYAFDSNEEVLASDPYTP